MVGCVVVEGDVIVCMYIKEVGRTMREKRERREWVCGMMTGVDSLVMLVYQSIIGEKSDERLKKEQRMRGTERDSFFACGY